MVSRHCLIVVSKSQHCLHLIFFNKVSMIMYPLCNMEYLRKEAPMGCLPIRSTFLLALTILVPRAFKKLVSMDLKRTSSALVKMAVQCVKFTYITGSGCFESFCLLMHIQSVDCFSLAVDAVSSIIQCHICTGRGRNNFINIEYFLVTQEPAKLHLCAYNLTAIFV